MTNGQLVMPGLIPDSYWVVTEGHAIIADGTRYLIIETLDNGLLIGWRDGIKLLHVGTLLWPEKVKRE